MDQRSPQVRPQMAQRPPAERSTTTFQPEQSYRKRAKWPIIVGVITLVLVLAVAGWWLLGSKGLQSPAGDRYQAIFLNNGQVFFGKLKNTTGEYLVLENAYYTKKQDIPADATAEQKAAVENNVSLVKVGKEVYGPESTMSIRASQVLFWQNLKSDSKVATAIDKDTDNK